MSETRERAVRPASYIYVVIMIYWCSHSKMQRSVWRYLRKFCCEIPLGNFPVLGCSLHRIKQIAFESGLRIRARSLASFPLSYILDSSFSWYLREREFCFQCKNQLENIVNIILSCTIADYFAHAIPFRRTIECPRKSNIRKLVQATRKNICFPRWRQKEWDRVRWSPLFQGSSPRAFNRQKRQQMQKQ